jgi:hypothetical protein
MDYLGERRQIEFGTTKWLSKLSQQGETVLYQGYHCYVAKRQVNGDGTITFYLSRPGKRGITIFLLPVTL